MNEHAERIIDDEAAAWAARALSGAMRPEEEAALADWMAADQRHRQAFERFMETAELASKAHEQLAAEELTHDLETFANQRSARTYWFIAAPAMAASIAAAALFFSAMMNAKSELERYATARGETATFTLADGSAVSLNTDSVLEVNFSTGARSVSLERGEALFDVIRDTERPFIVVSEYAEARVLGTRFNVHAAGDKTIVSVLSGVVEVDAKNEEATEAAAFAVTLIAGQQITVDADGGDNEVRGFNPHTITSWLRGKAYYENEPLSAVIADLNRYYAVQFVIGDASLNDIPVSGGFDLNNHDITAEALAAALSLRAEKDVAGKITLMPNG